MQVAAAARRAQGLEVVLLEGGVLPAAARQHLLRQLGLALDPPHRVRGPSCHLERLARNLDEKKTRHCCVVFILKTVPVFFSLTSLPVEVTPSAANYFNKGVHRKKKKMHRKDLENQV